MKRRHRNYELPPQRVTHGSNDSFLPGAPPVEDFNNPISESDSGLSQGFYRTKYPPNMRPQEPAQNAAQELEYGDAAAGIPQFRTTQFFWQVQATGQVPNDFVEPFVLCTGRSYDRRLRLWHVSFSGRDIIREDVAPQNPSSFATLLPGLGGLQAASMVKARLEIQNQSGRVFQDINIMGGRMIEVYAWAVTAYALLPVNAYEVSPVNPAQNRTFTGVVADSVFGAQVSGVAVNSTQFPNTNTIIEVVPAGTEVLVPIPPGAYEVEINAISAAPFPANFQFDTGAPVGTANPTSLGQIAFAAGTVTTGRLAIPNALSIRIGGLGDNGGTFSFTFYIDQR